MMKYLIPILIAAGQIGAAGSLAAAEASLIEIKGAIGPATVNYIARAIGVAESRHDACLIIQLDTPGGLLDSTKEIVQALYASKVPTVVYVAPPGAYAASAGTFITMAADVAAMAPNTSIGAAHPVEMGPAGAEKLDEVMKQKMENFASSEIEAIAQRRGRNADWASTAVRESASITAEKALDLNVIDLIAKDIPDLLRQLDSRQVGPVKLKTNGANVAAIPMDASEKLFQLLWTPEVMLILMLAAIYGLIGELSTPGAILPGVTGAIALVLVLYMSAILPVNLAGLALIGLAMVLFIIDLFAPTHGVLTAGGIVSFFLGALMLFNHAGPGFQLPLTSVITATALTAGFFLFFVGAGLRAQWLPVRTGREAMLGKIVPALQRVDASGGRVFVEGELWNAVSETAVEAGQRVEIIGIEGLTLKVKTAT
ncbi:MAG: nodulation protein NfeD [Verrucomicrobiota bacterium]|jgi:membrane-bound serine protease (ClpP class)